MVLFAGLAGCDFTESAETKTLVVETFIETNRPLPPVSLRQTQSLDSPTDSAGDPATDGQVQVVLDDQTVQYEEKSGQPGQYDPDGSSLTATSGLSWRLHVEWNGQTARAAGTVPPSIALSEICIAVPDEAVRAIRVDSLRRDSLDVPAEESYIYPIEVAMEWGQSNEKAPIDTTTWVRTQVRPDTSQFSSRLVDRFLESTDVRREDRFAGTGSGRRRWAGVYAVPVDTSTSPLPDHDLEVAVVRGDSTFGDFARTRADANLREPLSNVDGALGVALAVATDSVTQRVDGPGEECRRLAP